MSYDSAAEPDIGGRDYRNRIAMLPGDPPVAYRPGRYLLDDESFRSLIDAGYFADNDYTTRPVFDEVDDGEYDGDDNVDDDEGIEAASAFGQWHLVEGVADAAAEVDELVARGHRAELDIVYFANGADCCGCPPHPALAAEIAANPWTANPWKANPWKANPWKANPWTANPWKANAESLNLLATGKAPMSSVMPAPIGAEPPRRHHGVVPLNNVVIGVLDSGLAGGWDNADHYRPDLLGLAKPDLERISGPEDLPSRPMGGRPADNYLDPVAGHGTFIAGIIEQRTPGCTIRVERVIKPQGDVSVSRLAATLDRMMRKVRPAIVNFSFGGTGRSAPFESVIAHHAAKGVVFVAAAGNEGSCVEQYPAALPLVIGVAGLGPTGPAEWSNYGDWVDACAPGTDLVSSFFARFNGALPPINGIDADDFDQWATWTGTSFAAPVVVAALAREIVTTGCTAEQAVERVVRAPHLARLPYMGTVVNF